MQLSIRLSSLRLILIHDDLPKLCHDQNTMADDVSDNNADC